MYQSLSNWRNRVGIFSNWPMIMMMYLGLARYDSHPIIARDGVQISVATKMDLAIVDEVFIFRIYDQTPFQVPHEDATILDVGAHIGVFSLYASRGRNIKVFSYEPHPENFKTLELNIERNNLGKVIHPHKKAVSEVEGTRELFIDVENSGGHSFYGENLASHSFGKHGRSVTVQCTTLRRILTDNVIERCDFLKVDCEGAEYEIFANIDDGTLGKIGTICVECHGWAREKLAQSAMKMQHIASHLENAGYKVATDLFKTTTSGGVIGILRARNKTFG